MNRAIIIADDMTGANDTGAMLADQGYHAVSSPTPEVGEALVRSEVLTINADSRAMPRDQAYACVRGLVERFGREARLLSKRIDTTLRGNVGAEIDAVLDGLGEAACACVVTAAPRAERVCRQGQVYVAGVPLDQTDMARDVRCPMDTADVRTIIHRQSRRDAGLLTLEEVRGDLSGALAGHQEEILVFDAETDEDIALIAKAVAGMDRRVAAIDPGNFTAAYARCILPRQDRRTLLLVGSRSEASRLQLAYLVEKGMVHPVVPDIDRLLDGVEGERVLARLTELAKTDALLCVTLVGTEITEKSKANAQRLSDELARLGAFILGAMPQIDLCYACGGDVSQSLLREMKAEGERLISEVIPLAVYGEIIGGTFHGMRMITKGGAIGREDAIEVLLNGAEKLKSC